LLSSTSGVFGVSLPRVGFFFEDEETFAETDALEVEPFDAEDLAVEAFDPDVLEDAALEDADFDEEPDFEEEVPALEDEVPAFEDEVPALEDEVPDFEEEVPDFEEEAAAFEDEVEPDADTDFLTEADPDLDDVPDV
jgi:hypothetical protein